MNLTQNVSAKLKATKGITLHNGKLRGQFRLPGKNTPVRKSFGITPTIGNIQAAANKLGAIKQDISNGSYDIDPNAFWRKHFPGDVLNNHSNITLRDCFDSYHTERENELTESIISKLRTCKNWVDQGGILDKCMAEINHKDLNRLRKEKLKTCSPATVREYSQTLSQIFWFAISEEIINIDPFTKVKKLPAKDYVDTEDELIIPFSSSELSRLLAVIDNPQTKVIVEILSLTGLRPGELKALAWEDVNFDEQYIHVRHNIDRTGKLKGPKTLAGIRKVRILPRVIELLNQQKITSYEQPAILETVYYKNQRTKILSRRRVFLYRGKPFIRPEVTTTSGKWAGWLRDAEVSHRPAYQLRHTYASKMLSKGANHTWLAKQMGHANWGLIQKIYGKWVEDDNPDYFAELSAKFDEL